MRQRLSWWRAIPLGVAAFTAVVAPGQAAAAEPPSLRLFAADESLRVTPAESMHLGLWITASGGDFVIRARRPDFGRWKGAQIDPTTGATLRAIPSRLIDGVRGLRRFLEVSYLDRGGRPAGRRSLPFCPMSAERLSPDGPRVPTYSAYCGNSFPFVRGTLSGVDRGWAAPAAGFFGSPGRPLRLEPGRYEVRARIRAPYRRLLGVPSDAATARLRVRVVHGGREERHRLEGRVRPPAAAIHGTAASVVEAPPDPATLPDLAALPPWQVSTRSRRGRDVLQFAGSPWNAGPGPLQVEGYRRQNRDRLEAVQSFLDSAGNVTATAPAGEMAFHDAPGHRHWHFLQFVAYRIVRPSNEAVVRSRKQSFCLAATDAVDLTLPGGDPSPDYSGLGSACGDDRSIWIRQTLPAGWADTYDSSLPGQQFDITGVPNGRYLLEMRVNPRGQLQETTTANNVARRRVVLGGEPGRRSVRVAPWHGIRD